jgi:hypothetical protein
VRRAIPLAETSPLASGRRRALAVRIGGLAALTALVAGVALAARSAAAPARAERATATTIVVLDVSGSIEPAAAATIVRTLRRVGHGGGHAGLVVFSDDTEEVVPPDAPAPTLLRYVRLFRPGSSLFFRNPWSDTFSAGTQIGRGLAAARAALGRAGIRRARVILVSDLFDSQADMPRMRRELLAYVRDPALELRVAAVPDYSTATAALYRRVLGSRSFAVAHPPATAAPPAARRGFPFLAVALVAVAALVLAAYELLAAPLSWREAAA